jgi:hypothetical protein
LFLLSVFTKSSLIEDSQLFKEDLESGKTLVWLVYVSCLPPVIFVQDKRCPRVNWKDTFVLRVRSSKGPGVDMVKRWVDTVSDYMEDEPILLLDSLKAHKNKEVLELLHELGVRTLFFPPGCGKYLDPVDNSFNSAFKTHYYKQRRDTHIEMLRAIRNSYFKATEENIQHYFTCTGYLSNKPAHVVAEQLLSQGYGSGVISRRQQLAYISKFKQWAKCNRLLQKQDIRLPTPPNDGESTTLDGSYWQLWKVL